MDEKWVWEQKVKDWTRRFKQAEGSLKERQDVLQSYLKSDVWEKKRKQVLKRADGRCENKKCGAILLNPSSLQVHHINYERVGGNEKLEDLIALCYECHRKADKKRERQSEERKNKARYQARLEGFASWRYGDSWRYDMDEKKVEEEFKLFLYKNYCEEHGIDYNPEDELEILEFWNSVLEGND